MKQKNHEKKSNVKAMRREAENVETSTNNVERSIG